MFNSKINFQDFHDYDSLIADPETSKNLVTSYQDIFGDPQLWGETYSQQDIENKLRDELSGNAGLRLCTTTEPKSNKNKLLGFCWAQQLELNGVKKAIESIQYYKAIGSPKIQETLKQILNDKPVLYMHDLGITKSYRGRVSLQKLICPALNSLAQRSQTNRLLFWSIKESRIFRLAEFAGFKLVATVEGMQFFIGDIDIC